MKSTEFLQAAIDVQAERGQTYDKPTGERSMGATISAFNCITGYTLEESDGWMLLSLLKLVRQSQNPEQYHHDSALDFVAYASLYAEAASEQCGQVEKKEEQEWIESPEWAQWLAKDRYGQCWFQDKPELHKENNVYVAPFDSLGSNLMIIPGAEKSTEPKLLPRPTSTAK